MCANVIPHAWPGRSWCPHWPATSPAGRARPAGPAPPGGAGRTRPPSPTRSGAASRSPANRSRAHARAAAAMGWRCGPCRRSQRSRLGRRWCGVGRRRAGAVGPGAGAPPAPRAPPVRGCQQGSSWRWILPDQPQRSETTSKSTPTSTHQIAPELVSITLLPLQGAAAPTTPATASPRLRPRRPHRRGLQRSPAPGSPPSRRTHRCRGSRSPAGPGEKMATTSTSDSSPVDRQAGVGPVAGCGRFLVGHQRSPSVAGSRELAGSCRLIVAALGRAGVVRGSVGRAPAGAPRGW